MKELRKLTFCNATFHVYCGNGTKKTVSAVSLLHVVDTTWTINKRQKIYDHKKIKTIMTCLKLHKMRTKITEQTSMARRGGATHTYVNLLPPDDIRILTKTAVS